MYEYGIRNVKTNERTIIFGYSWNNAVQRSKLDNEADWTIEYYEYVD